MAGSLRPLNSIEGYQNNEETNDSSASLTILKGSLHESAVEGEYDLRSNITDGGKRLLGMQLISDADHSGINTGEHAANEVKNTARTPKKLDNIINEPEASLHPGDSSDPQSSKHEKNRNESSINTEDWKRLFKRALSANAIRSRNHSRKCSSQLESLNEEAANLKEEMQEVKREMQKVKREMQEVKREMQEVKKENASLRKEMTRMRQRIDINDGNQYQSMAK